jgi:cytochrome b involved in lipid metabolism
MPQRFYTPEEVAVHNTAKDCWVSIFQRVFDLSETIKLNRGPLTQPIIDNAGKDLSHWFDEKTGGLIM